MGFVRDSFGRIAIETRRESFVVHYGDDESSHPTSHPEFLFDDLDDLIAALTDARDARDGATL